MKNHLKLHYHRYLIVVLYALVVVYMKYNYPNPTIAWDTNYYIAQSITGDAGIRPEGYPVFLNWLYQFSHSLNTVLVVQYLLYFLSIVVLLEVFVRVFRINRLLYIILGVLMLIEPTGLFFTNTIYSDQPFSVLTFFYIATLLAYVNYRKIYWLLLHILVLYCCLEVRFLSLFYPFFSILAILLTMKKGLVLKVVACLLIFFTFKFSYNRNVRRNTEAFGVPVHSAFSGWTYANNAMYALPRINTQAKFIKDPELREMHAGFMKYFDTTENIQVEINTNYLWNVDGPLFPIMMKANDSLWSVRESVPLYMDMFVVAPKLEKYGLYIQRQYPYEYLMGYLLPNAKTMFHPHQGEMHDYYYFYQLSDESKARYNIKDSDISCRKDIFEQWVNDVNDKWYKRRLILFALAILGFLWLWYKRRLSTIEIKYLGIAISFVILFYGAMIYSSWCIYRYVLPVLPVMTIVTILTAYRFVVRAKDQ